MKILSRCLATTTVFFLCVTTGNAQKSNARGLTDEALAQLMLGNFATALSYATNAIKADNNMALAYAVRGRALTAAGDYTGAETDLKKAISLAPVNARRGTYYAFLSYNYVLKGEDKTIRYRATDSARTLLYKTTVEVKPAVALEAYARALVEKSDLTDTNDDAIAYATYAIDLAPEFALAYALRGMLHKRHTDKNPQHYEKAVADYTRALAINTSYYDAFIGRAEAYELLKEYDTALKDYDKAISLNPKEPTGYNWRANFFINKLDYSRAIADYTKAVELAPKEPAYYWNRALTYEAVGDFGAADADWLRYKDLGGKNAPSNTTRQEAIYPASRFDASKAKFIFEKGGASISGRACSNKEGQVYYAKWISITLYPVTPYLEEWIDLRKKNKNKNTSVFMTQEASKYAVLIQSNENGEFTFEGLAPGKYYLEAYFDFTVHKTVNVYDGYQREGPVMVHYWSKRHVQDNYDERLQKFVEIKQDGENVKRVSLTKKGGGGCFGL